MINTFYYWFSSFVLGIILFFPVRTFILNMGINRHQRKVQRNITDEEREALLRKITPVAALVAVTFAFIFQKVMLLKLFGQGGR